MSLVEWIRATVSHSLSAILVGLCGHCVSVCVCDVCAPIDLVLAHCLHMSFVKRKRIPIGRGAHVFHVVHA